MTAISRIYSSLMPLDFDDVEDYENVLPEEYDDYECVDDWVYYVGSYDDNYDLYSHYFEDNYWPEEEDERDLDVNKP